MSSKRSRRSLALRRAGAGLVVGALGTTLVVVYVDRSRHHTETVKASTSTPTSAVHAEVAALDGTYDVDVTVAGAEYGTTWPNTKLTTGQHLAQHWTIDCRLSTCQVSIGSGHVAEDPDGATLST